MRILGLVILIAVVAGALWSGAFVDIPSLLIVIGLTLASMLAAYGMGIGTAFRALFSGTGDRGSIQQAISIWRRTQSMAIISGGVLGTFIGLVIMLVHMDDPAAIGPGMAVAFLTTVYSLILAFGVIQPVLCVLRQKLADTEQ